MVYTIIQRAFSIVEHSFVSTELTHVIMTLLQNSYNPHTISRTMARHPNPASRENPEPIISTAFLPNIQGVTNRSGKTLHKHNIKPIF